MSPSQVLKGTLGQISLRLKQMFRGIEQSWDGQAYCLPMKDSWGHLVFFAFLFYLKVPLLIAVDACLDLSGATRRLIAISDLRLLPFSVMSALCHFASIARTLR